MRDIDAETLAALNGSRKGDTITVYAWYDGETTHEGPLPISQWRLSWDSSRQVQTFNCTVHDDTGQLAPWLLEDPLGVGGAQLQVIYNVGGAGSVNMGWYRITNPVPEERWRTYIIDSLGQINAGPVPDDKKLVMVSGGASVTLAAADLALNIKNDRFLAPSSPVGASPTVVSEVTRLLADIVPVVAEDDVVDESVSKRLIYEVERLDAVEDLCKQIGCSYRMNGDGQFEIYRLEEAAPVWVIAGGPEGVLVRPDRQQNLEGLYNIFVAEGTTTAGTPIRAIAKIEDGPLMAGGPHGNYPTFYNSTMITTQSQANAYAIKMRDTQLRGLTVDLDIECLPHPGLQQGDWVTVAAPVVGMQTVTLNGRVKRMDLASNGNTVAPMNLTVECSYSAVAAAIGQVAR